MAGKKWLTGFMFRHPELSLRKPEPPGMKRASAFNKAQVTKFFELLQQITRDMPDDILASHKLCTITIECCMSPLGQFVPPMIIFPRKRMQPNLMKDAPPGSVGKCSDNGWMESSIFFEWLKHFVKFTGASPNDRFVLILDGHVRESQIMV